MSGGRDGRPAQRQASERLTQKNTLGSHRRGTHKVVAWHTSTTMYISAYVHREREEKRILDGPGGKWLYPHHKGGRSTIQSLWGKNGSWAGLGWPHPTVSFSSRCQERNWLLVYTFWVPIPAPPVDLGKLLCFLEPSFPWFCLFVFFKTYLLLYVSVHLFLCVSTYAVVQRPDEDTGCLPLLLSACAV